MSCLSLLSVHSHKSVPISATHNSTIRTKDCVDRSSLASDDSGFCNSEDGHMGQNIYECSASSSLKINSRLGLHLDLPECPEMMDVSPTTVTSESAMEVCRDEPDGDKKSCDNAPQQLSAVNPSNSCQPPSKQSWLLRLFESRLFDMSIAITYLFKSKEAGVQSYIGKQLLLLLLFSFKKKYRVVFISVSRVE